MTGTFKLALASGALLAVLPFLFAFAPQDPESKAVMPDAFRQEVVWNFAVLQYTNDADQLVEVPASLLSRMWLVSMGDGRMRLELLYQNRDYSMVDLRGFSVLRRSDAHTAVDIPVVRCSIDGMAFPAFR